MNSSNPAIDHDETIEDLRVRMVRDLEQFLTREINCNQEDGGFLQSSAFDEDAATPLGIAKVYSSPSPADAEDMSC